MANEPRELPPAPPSTPSVGSGRPALPVPQWLEELKGRSDDERVVPVWALVFSIGPPPGFAVPEECRLLVERIAIDAGLGIDFFFSRDEDEIFITVGGSEATVEDEATRYMQVPLRLRHRDPETGQEAEDGTTMEGSFPFHSDIKEHFVPSSDVMFFRTGTQQRLVMNRIQRAAKINLEMKLLAPSRAKLLQEAWHHVHKKTRMQVFALMQLAEAFGCTSGESQAARAVRTRLPVSVERYCEWKEMALSLKVEVQYFEDVVTELQSMEDADAQYAKAAADPTSAIATTRGLNAQSTRLITSGSLRECYPLHFEDELAYLKDEWGSFSRIYTNLIVRDKHGVRHFGPHYQPLDEIRDYFGEHLALYFAWVGLCECCRLLP